MQREKSDKEEMKLILLLKKRDGRQVRKKRKVIKGADRINYILGEAGILDDELEAFFN